MSNSTIGIKTADGKFFPILEDGSKKRKRLVVTTVRDNQSKVQIDLYRGDGNKLENASYIGSLVIENIQPAPKGEPEIELYIGIDNEGNLNAVAHDLITDEKQSLTVSIDSLSEESTYDFPDFDIEEKFDFDELNVGESPDTVAEETALGESPIEEPKLTGETYPIGETDSRKKHIERKKRNPLFMILFVIISLVVIAVIAYLIFSNLHGERVPPLIGGSTTEKILPVSNSPPTVGTKAPEKEVSSVSKAGGGKVSGRRVSSAEGGKSKNNGLGNAVKQKKSQKGGVWYRVKRGDTLWDISSTFYRNPWLYPVIARRNRIKNPDLIFAGTKIFIPER